MVYTDVLQAVEGGKDMDEGGQVKRKFFSARDAILIIAAIVVILLILPFYKAPDAPDTQTALAAMQVALNDKYKVIALSGGYPRLTPSDVTEVTAEGCDLNSQAQKSTQPKYRPPRKSWSWSCLFSLKGLTNERYATAITLIYVSAKEARSGTSYLRREAGNFAVGFIPVDQQGNLLRKHGIATR
jgi:hypothetical protein